MSESLPDSFDPKQPDLPTLAVDPDPEVSGQGQQPAKYSPAAQDDDRVPDQDTGTTTS
ncbi:chromosome partitioning protein [Cellulomonas carbonis]|uniref:Chromosome partitioning protein n=1 Tax=Cellulomonas carbonis T26 TaxID=947969 RepID=A0A0A0BUN9_9CELL|nr:chromosome partitioning protein [Cellulomonas carbonis]KGM10849.1 chromosome partitioning protein [Cellulomonas carbonis T26]GGB92401.1 hypothetical protein GCM10010972_01360 [Cellulomonas carbonis]